MTDEVGFWRSSVECWEWLRSQAEARGDTVLAASHAAHAERCRKELARAEKAAQEADTEAIERSEP